jgi:hypothetical protein
MLPRLLRRFKMPSPGAYSLSQLRKDGHSSGCYKPISGPSNVAILSVISGRRMFPRYS